MSFSGEPLVEGQIGGQGQQAGQPARVSQALVEGDGAALREAGEHGPVLGHAALGFPARSARATCAADSRMPGRPGACAVEGRMSYQARIVRRR